MTLSFNSTRNIIFTLVALLIFTSLLGAASFLAVQPVHAGLPVADILGTAAQWAITAIEWIGQKAWDGVMWVAEKSWDMLKQSWDWVRENIKAVLIAAAMKVAATWLMDQVQRLVQDRRIESYLYYADFLVRNVYTFEHIRKNYEGEARDAQIIAALVGNSQELYGRMQPGETAYQGVKAATTLNPKCQTATLSPQDPNYYARLQQSQSIECLPTFAFAAYRDATFSAINESKLAADAEIYNSGGYKATRPCGTIATKDITQLVSNPDATIDEEGNFIGNAFINQPTGDKTVDVLPTVSSAICAFISQPGSYAANTINTMIDQVVNISVASAEQNSQNTQMMRSFLSNILASNVHRLIFGGQDGDSVIQFTGSGQRLAGTTPENPGYNFGDQIPDGLDINNRQGDVGLDYSGTSSGRDQETLREFWVDLCEEKLPLMFAWQNNNYVENAPALGADNLEKGVIVAASGNEKRQYLPPRNLLKNGASISTKTEQIGSNYFALFYQNFSGFGQDMSIKNMLTIPFNWRQLGKGNSSGEVYYKYIWQIHEPVNRFEESDNSNFDDEIAFGRRYAMALDGYPTGEDIEESRQWVPENWPYFVDSGGKGYQYNLNGTIIPDPYANQRIDNGTGPEGSAVIHEINSDGESIDNTIEKVRIYDKAINQLGVWGDINTATSQWRSWILNEEVEIIIIGNKITVIEVDYEGNEILDKTLDETGVVDNVNDSVFSGDINYVVEYTDKSGAVHTYVAEIVNGSLNPHGETVDNSPIAGSLVDNGGIVYSIDSGSTNQLYENTRIFNMGGDLIVMNSNRTNQLLWKLQKNISVVVKDGEIVIKSDGYSSENIDNLYAVRFEENGQQKVMIAEKLSLQAPCGQEPFGPPFNISDLGLKIKYSKDISPELWNWVQTEKFIEDAQQQTF